MSTRFFCVLACVWSAFAFVAFWQDKEAHYTYAMAALFLATWSIMRKLDGKAPL